MIELIITLVIVIFAVYIIGKSLKNSSQGKCNGNCSKCRTETKCHEKSDER
ncbi:FeoB-associated Cys-rich membrane protein [uncultured Clostridium sp.]|uniref:FeoB-associated Cys-rich membrane protein n=1 Tax=uncultured Clostridium sp. TaxID=59620 RepID=UPI002601357C|nr:FeoB-associated Cys-rich membrane protein [uncultured Clostridium sp.]